jgi:precorrin-6A/cobalt-precorrin-6A reductase
MSVPEPPHLLILGGTGEGAALAAAVEAQFGAALRITTSLAGRTPSPSPLPCRLRIGGFGGAAAMAAYLVVERVRLVVDATHPFAVRISAEAAKACRAAAVPLLTIDRPPWRRHRDDRWIEVGDLSVAAMALSDLGRRVFLTVGGRGLKAFAGLAQHHFLLRLVAAPAAPPPLPSYALLLARGPFTLADERRILAEHAIEVLVAKASGGSATEAKLVAARERRLPVVMVRRPEKPAGERVDGIAEAIGWIQSHLPIGRRCAEEPGS